MLRSVPEKSIDVWCKELLDPKVAKNFHKVKIITIEDNSKYYKLNELLKAVNSKFSSAERDIQVNVEFSINTGFFRLRRKSVKADRLVKRYSFWFAFVMILLILALHLSFGIMGDSTILRIFNVLD